MIILSFYNCIVGISEVVSAQHCVLNVFVKLMFSILTNHHSINNCFVTSFFKPVIQRRETIVPHRSVRGTHGGLTPLLLFADIKYFKANDKRVAND